MRWGLIIYRPTNTRLTDLANSAKVTVNYNPICPLHLTPSLLTSSRSFTNMYSYLIHLRDGVDHLCQSENHKPATTRLKDLTNFAVNYNLIYPLHLTPFLLASSRSFTNMYSYLIHPRDGVDHPCQSENCRPATTRLKDLTNFAKVTVNYNPICPLHLTPFLLTSSRSFTNMYSYLIHPRDGVDHPCQSENCRPATTRLKDLTNFAKVTVNYNPICPLHLMPFLFTSSRSFTNMYSYLIHLRDGVDHPCQSENRRPASPATTRLTDLANFAKVTVNYNPIC
jgi:hypothetical protein